MDEAWRERRRATAERIERLRRQGVCYSCHQLRTRQVFPDQALIWEAPLFQFVLEQYPRMRGHSILIWKAHRRDFSELLPEELGPCMGACRAAAAALSAALGADRVYLNTMCDGELNHLHFQLFPRYAGERMGSSRFVLPRQPAEHAIEDAAAIRAAFGRIWQEETGAGGPQADPSERPGVAGSDVSS